MFVYVLYSVITKDFYKEIYGVLSSKQKAMKVKELCQDNYPQLQWKIQKLQLDNAAGIKI